MIDLGYKDLLYRYKFKKNLFFIFSVILLILLLGIVISFCCLINYANRTIYFCVGIPLFIVFSFLFSFFLCCLYFPCKNNFKHIKHVCYGTKTKCTGKILNIHEEVSLPLSGRGREIIIGDETDTWVVYFDCLFGKACFKEGDEVELILSSSFIMAYKIL